MNPIIIPKVYDSMFLTWVNDVGVTCLHVVKLSTSVEISILIRLEGDMNANFALSIMPISMKLNGLSLNYL